MSTAPDRIRAKWLRPPLLVRKAAVDTARMFSKAVLSYPVVDLAGDYVNPSGLNFAPHHADPSADLEHKRHPAVRGMPVAWLRDSLSEPGGDYAVEYKSLNVADDGKPADYQFLPVGTFYFDKSCRVSSQVFALVEQDALPAVSLEFKPVEGFYKELGPSPLEKRLACHFDRADVVGIAICARGVNEGALAFTKSLGAVTQVPDALGKILADRKLNVGGTVERLHDRIYKALLPAAPERPKPNRVRVEQPMIPDDDTQDDDDAQLASVNDAALTDLNGNGVAGQDEEGGPPPTAKAAYSLAQGLKDLCDQIRQQFAKGEHKKGKRQLEAICQRADQASQLAMGVGKMIDADLAETPDDAEEGDDEEAETEADDESDATAEGDEGADKGPPKKTKKPDPEATDEDMDEDDEGVLKGIPATFKKGVKRFRLADLEAPVVIEVAAPVAKAADGAEPNKIAALEGAVEQLTKRLKFL